MPEPGPTHPVTYRAETLAPIFALLPAGESAAVIASASLLPGTRQCVVHGDLHGGNFFVDKHGNTWVMDFERTGPGHVLADFVELEHDILRQHTSNLDLSTFYRVIIGLTIPFSVDRASVEDPLVFEQTILAVLQDVEKSVRSEVEKTLRIIHELRKIAVGMFSCKNLQEYYWGLLLDTLFSVQRLERQEKSTPEDEVVKQKELLLASILCQRLKNGQSEWLQPSQTSGNATSGTRKAEVTDMNAQRVTDVIKILFLAANASADRQRVSRNQRSHPEGGAAGTICSHKRAGRARQ